MIKTLLSRFGIVALEYYQAWLLANELFLLLIFFEIYFSAGSGVR